MLYGRSSGTFVPTSPISATNSLTIRIHGHGEMAGLIRSHDWATTRLGAIEQWPAELVSAINMILSSPLPMQIFWGREMTTFYNDALKIFMTGKHPGVLGKPCREAWSEAWPTVGEQLESVLHRGKAISFDHILLPILRNGVLEDLYWNYSYSPLYGPGGGVEGILNIAQDLTAEVIAQQELRASEAPLDPDPPQYRRRGDRDRLGGARHAHEHRGRVAYRMD